MAVVTGPWYLPTTRFDKTVYWVDYSLRLHAAVRRLRPGYRGTMRFDIDDLMDIAHLNNIVYQHIGVEQMEFTTLMDGLHMRYKQGGKVKFTCSIQQWQYIAAAVTEFLAEVGTMSWINFSKAGNRSKKYMKR